MINFIKIKFFLLGVYLFAGDAWGSDRIPLDSDAGGSQINFQAKGRAVNKLGDIEFIPDEIFLSGIFPYLDLGALGSFRSVSRACHDLIDDYMNRPYLKNTQFNQFKKIINNKNFQTILGLFKKNNTFIENIFLDLHLFPINEHTEKDFLSFALARRMYVKYTGRFNGQFLNCFSRLEILELHFPRNRFGQHVLAKNDQFLKLEKLRELTLVNYNFPQLISKEMLGRLRVFRINKCDDAGCYLDHLMRVKKLSIERCTFLGAAPVDSKALQDLKCLKVLNCQGGLLEMLPPMRSLREVTLRKIPLTSNSANRFINCQNIHFINVSIQDESARNRTQILNILTAYKANKITLDNCHDVRVEDFSPISVRQLSLKKYTVQDIILSPFRHLNILSLIECAVNDAQLINCKMVTCLKLIDCPQVDGWFLKRFHQLQHLEVKNCKRFNFTTAVTWRQGNCNLKGAQAFENIDFNPFEKITKLVIEGLVMTDYMLNLFENISNLEMTKCLQLKGERLKLMKNLEEVQLTKCTQFTEYGLSAFSNARTIKIINCKKINVQSIYFLNSLPVKPSQESTTNCIEDNYITQMTVSRSGKEFIKTIVWKREDSLHY